MQILDVLNAPWAIEPSKLLELQGIYSAQLSGESIDIAAVEARIGRPLANDQQRTYDIIDGVAVISIEGVVAKKMNMFSQISGGASLQLARQALDAANSDPAVHSVVLSIDSPGGTVDGTQAFADVVRASRDIKPIVTLGSGNMSSAAYWFGSAARAVYIADNTTAVGSIGVVATHTDISGAETARGIKTTEVSAGKYKRVASQYGALSEEGRQSIQDKLDYMYSLFVGAVAANRGVGEDVVLRDMADGRVFIGQQAVDAGLVDGIITLESLVAQLNQEREAARSAPTPSRAGPARPIQSTNPKGNSMDRQQIEAEHPALAAELRAEGATTERARIQSIEAQAVAGHEDLIVAMKFDGKSTAGDAAIAVLAAEKTARAAHAKAAANEAPNPVPAAAPPAAAAPAAADKSRADLDKEAKVYMAAHPGTTYITAFKAVGGN